MRSVAGWIGVLWLVAGCTVPSDVARTCTADADCGQGGLCDLSVGLCYAAGTEPPVDPNSCSPLCPDYQVCTRKGCADRFTALTILTPTANAAVGGGPVQVQAQLKATPAYEGTTTYPDTLVFSATRGDGGGDPGSFGVVSRNGDTYTVQWTPPSGQTQVTITASHPVPAAVQSASVTVRLDTVAPTFVISFSSPPTRAVGSQATQADQRDPAAGYDTAFRRDESVTVTVSADEPVTNAMLTVIGIGPGGSAGQAQAPVTLSAATACGGNPPFCGTATVDLSVPEMHDVRGTMGFQVEGQDAVGNRGSANAGLKVTRWKWAFDIGGNLLGTPAIGNKGTVYVGTSVVGNGKTLAISPEGALKWTFATGDVVGSPAVGAYAANDEYVYVAAKTAANVPAFFALSGASGTDKKQCLYNGTSELPSAIAVGLTQGTPGPVETGVTLYNSAQVRIVSIRPDAMAGTECIDISGTTVPSSVPGGAVVLKDQNLFYGTADLRVTSYDLATGSNAPRAGWPQNTGSLARGLTVLGNTLHGAASNSDDPSQGSLFSVPVAGGSRSVVYPATGGSRVFNVSIGTGEIAWFGAETGTTNELMALALTTVGATPVRAANVGTLRGAPVLAKNDRLYTLNSQGRVVAWAASTLAPLWDVLLSPGPGNTDVSPTLDCRRDAAGQAVAGLDTLYVPAATKLYAFIGDSSGLDPNAPWPKFQHDARNTGNPATPITSCP